MYLSSILSFGLLASTTAAQFYYQESEKTQPEEVKQKKPKKNKENQTTVDKANDLADQLERAQFLIRGVKKCLKWTKKGIKPLVLFIRSGAMSEDLGKWVKSPKAFELYALVCGSIFLTHQNIKPLKGTLFNQFSSVAWTLLGESRKITESYNLVTSISDFAKNPRGNLLPLAFAAAMIAARRMAT